MPRRFRKNPHVDIVIIPGHGRVYDIDILEGDHYGDYAPHLLSEVGVPAPAPVRTPVRAAAANPVLHDALAIAARETVPVEEPPRSPQVITPEMAIFANALLSESQPETNSANSAPVATMVEGQAPATPEKRKRGRPRKVPLPT
jgi:hypothetical protein